MSVPKCANCKLPMRHVSGVNKLFLGKYIVSDASVFVCGQCGEEYLEPKEYERIRKKVQAVESKTCIPAVHEVMAKAKFLVL